MDYSECWKLLKCVSIFPATDTDNMGQFFGPEIDIMGLRLFMGHINTLIHAFTSGLLVPTRSPQTP
jgi:hypothetical protein